MAGSGSGQSLAGGAGNDILDASNGGGAYSLSGGAGADTLIATFDGVAFYDDSSLAVTVNLADGAAFRADGNDSLVGISVVYGGNGNDSLLGFTNATASLYGGAGDDALALDD